MDSTGDNTINTSKSVQECEKEWKSYISECTNCEDERIIKVEQTQGYKEMLLHTVYKLHVYI